MWDEITYPIPNFDGRTVDVRMDKSFHPTLYWACYYLSMLGLKVICISKRVPGTLKTVIPFFSNFLLGFVPHISTDGIPVVTMF